jgi:YD repeat-containing protein
MRSSRIAPFLALLIAAVASPAAAHRIFSSGFELGTVSAGEYEWAGATTLPTLTTTDVRTGTYALTVDTSSNREGMEKSIASVPEVYARCYFRFASFPNVESSIMAISAAASTTEIARITIDASGVVRLRDEDAGVDLGPMLNTGSYYRLELHVNAGAAAGSDVAELRVDGVDEAVLTGRDYATNPASWVIGRNLNAEGANSGTWNIDDCGLNDTAGVSDDIHNENTWPGDGRIVHLRPNGNGDADAGSLSSGGSVGCSTGEARWGCLVTTDDGNTWVGLDGNTSTVDVAVDDLALPANTQVQFVAVGIRFTCESTNPCNHIAGVKSQAGGTVASTTTPITLSSGQSNIFFSHHDDPPRLYRLTQYKDPQNTTLRWTDATLDTMQLRVATTDGNPDTNVTAVWALVEYESTAPPVPTITSLNPSNGGVGQGITIAGANFGGTQGSSTVTFNGTAASPTNWSATSITTAVPIGATSGPVVVTVGGVASNGVIFTVIPPPSITSLTPTSGPVGQAVTIAGANFGATQGSSTVTFNGTAATVTSWSSTSIGTTVPTGAATGPVVVTANGQASNGVTFTVITPPPTSSIQYQYDALGRLVTVIDRDGNSATYNYDAVGNLLSIIRSTASVVTITGFSPTSGFAGTSITITGSGFSPTLAENTVAFNGRRADVTSSTPTAIVATVPVGAATGPVSVVTPTGSAVSNGVFTVVGGGALPNQPLITSFTPSSGTPSIAVSLSGVNFDPDVADNQVSFNGTAATVTAATTTTLSTSVPSGATSGPISVITPAGQTTSADDFIVPPSPYVVSDVEDFDRISYGETVSVNLADAQKIALLLFDGTAGDWINLRVLEGDVEGPFFGGVTLTLRDPAGAVLFQEDPSSEDWFSGIRLPATGTYTVAVSVDAPVTPVTFQLEVTADYLGSIVVDGPSVRATIRQRNQNARLLFNGTAGERVGIHISEAVPFSTLIQLARDDGFELAFEYVSRDTCLSPCFLDTVLPATATYMVVIDPEIDEVGSITVRAVHPPADAVGSITANGVGVPATNTAIGQNVRLTFSATAGDRVSFEVTPDAIGVFTEIRLFAPDGTVLAEGELNSGMNYIDALTLPATGTYAIEVDPHGADIGTATVKLYSISDLVASATIGGGPVSLPITTPGQNATVTFNGAMGQHVGMQFTGVSTKQISLKAPDGTVLISPTIGPAFLDTVLPTSGTYTIVVDPTGKNIGTATVTLTEPAADLTGSIIPGGSPVPVSIVSAGQKGVISFDATSGDRVSLRFTSVTIQQTTASIRKPDGTTLATLTFFTSGGFIDTNVLADTGTFTIVVDPAREFTGDVTLTLYSVPADGTTTGTIDGGPVTVTVGTPGQGAALTFSGSAGQHVGVNLTGVTISSSNVTVLNPDSSVLIPSTVVNTSGKFLDADLPTTGDYTVRVDSVGVATGSMTVTLSAIPADLTDSITAGGSPVTVSLTTAGRNARVTFSGSAGQRVSLHMTGVTMSSSVVSILKPDGSSLVSTTVGTSGGFIDTNVLASPGTYTIVVNPNAAATGNMTLTLYDVPADLSGSIAPDGTPVTVTIGTPGQNATLAFSANIAQRISLRISSVTISSVTVSILAPDGSSVASATVGTSGGFIDTQVLKHTGTFTVTVNPGTNNTGGLTLTLYTVPADATASIVVGGPTATLTTTTPGQNAAVSFDGTIGQQITVQITGNTMGSVTVKLLKTDNSVFTSTTSSAASFNLASQTIPITGPYRITIDPASFNTGSITVAVTSP